QDGCLDVRGSLCRLQRLYGSLSDLHPRFPRAMWLRSRSSICNRRNIRLGSSELETIRFALSTEEQSRWLRGCGVISFCFECSSTDYAHCPTLSFPKLIWYFHGDRDARFLRLASAHVRE